MEQKQKETEFFSSTLFWSDHPNDHGYPDISGMLQDIKDLVKRGTVAIEWNGHFLSDTDAGIFQYCNNDDEWGLEYYLSKLYVDRDVSVPVDRMVSVIQAAIDGDIIEPIEIDCMRLTRCSECGNFLKLSFDGKTLRIINACTKPKGALPYSFQIEVPSGKLYVANDLRSLCPDAEYEWGKEPDDKSRDINTRAGSAQTTLDYAVHNMAHVCVGNTCPGVYKKENGEFFVGNPVYDDENEAADETGALPFEYPCTEVASICTDLWWFSMIDEDEARRRFDEHIKSEWHASEKCEIDISERTFEKWMEWRNCEIVDVEPGTYQFDVLDHDRDDYEAEIIFSNFYKID